MQCISIQIKPDAIATFDKQGFLQRVRALGRSPEIDDFEEKGIHYLNFNFFTEIPVVLWNELKGGLYEDLEYGPYLGPISLVACEGEEGGLLLYHFDPAEKLDQLS